MGATKFLGPFFADTLRSAVGSTALILLSCPNLAGPDAHPIAGAAVLLLWVTWNAIARADQVVAVTTALGMPEGSSVEQLGARLNGR